MLLTILTSSLMSGVTIVMCKLLTELGQSKELGSHIVLDLIMMVTIAFSGMTQVHMLNKAMKYYDQLEVVPIYQTASMTLWICTGLIVFDEASLY